MAKRTLKNFITFIHRFIMGLKRPSKESNKRKLASRGELLSTFIIREATIQDLDALAALHVKTWRETYLTVGSSPTFGIRKAQWDQQFRVNDGSWFCFVVESPSGELVGFAKGQAYNHADLPDFSGELNKIYLLREYQRLGLGRKLVGQVAKQFLSQGISNMVLFGAAENPSCKFHEALGGTRLVAKNGEFHGGYCWRDLQKLALIASTE
ncbi:MAG TPA: GNAT family N-acetyltransferase [Cyclobacteriaceae bacterium]|nr:GNAT family N-acetyltransferase [Cyclobacteriaceae bacterium]